MLFEIRVANANAVEKQTIIDDMTHFIESFKNSQNTSFEYVTKSATFKIVEAEKSVKLRRPVYVDGACHSIK